MTNPNDLNIGINITGGSLQLLRQLNQQMALLRQQLVALNRANQQFAGRAGGAGGQGIFGITPRLTTNVGALGLSFRGLASSVAAAAAAFGAFAGFKNFIQEGLEFNRIIETANLGIATLITSQTKMTDSFGNSITGLDKLRVAQALAADQIQKLRVAGLQTAATTEQLSVAFQQAVGVGLRWGLTLDQIRVLTIQVSQAALGLGVPLNQLNEEIRSLLTGTITPRNTRIATALGITNDMIRQAQAAGTLFQFVNSRLEAFTQAGIETQKTFVGILSNVKEALQNLAGDATKPLFDQLKVAGQETLAQIFDFKNARIRESFAGLVDLARVVFGDLGKLLADALRAAVDGAKSLSEFLDKNAEQVAAIYNAMKLVGGQVLALVKDVFSLVGMFEEAAFESGQVAGIITQIARGVALVRTILDGILLVFGNIGAFVISGLLVPLGVFAKLTAKLVSVFNDDLAASINASGDAMIKFASDTQTSVQSATLEFLKGENAFTRFDNALKKTQETMAKQSAANRTLAKSLREITAEEDDNLELLDTALKKNQITQAEFAKETNVVRLNSVRRQIEAQKLYFNSIDQSDDRERRHTLDILKELKKREDALKKDVTLKSIAEPAPAKDSAVKRAQGATDLIKEELAERLKDLKINLDNQKLSFEEYFNAVAGANINAFDDMIKVQKELLSKTTNLGARQQIEEEIKVLELKKNQAIEDADEDLRKAIINIDAQVTQAHVQLLKDQGRLSEAAALETEEKFKKLIAILKKEGRTGDASIVEQLLGIETAKTRLDELTKQASEAQQTLSTQLSAINVQQEAGTLTEREAREKIVEAYKAAHDELGRMLPELREQARITGDPTAIDNVNQLAIRFEEMGITIKRLNDNFFEFKQAARDASISALADVFTGAASLPFQDKTQINALKTQLAGAQTELAGLLKGPQTAEAQRRISELREEIAGVTVELKNSESEIVTWQNLLINAARSIVSALQRVVSEMLATLIIQKTMRFLGGFSGGGPVQTVSSGGVNAASGGYIKGPGTATSDSIPAWLSNGEFVMRAAAVQSVGLDLLNQINRQGSFAPRLRSRGRGYADGGAVVAPPGGTEQSMSALLSLEDGLIVKSMRSTDGVKAIVSVIGQNRRTIKALLG